MTRNFNKIRWFFFEWWYQVDRLSFGLAKRRITSVGTHSRNGFPTKPLAQEQSGTWNFALNSNENCLIYLVDRKSSLKKTTYEEKLQKKKKCRTLQTAFAAHGFFKHAFWHLSIEHCWSFSQSPSLKQLFFTEPLIITKKLMEANVISRECLAIFPANIAQLELNRQFLNADWVVASNNFEKQPFESLTLNHRISSLPIEFCYWLFFFFSQKQIQ